MILAQSMTTEEGGKPEAFKSAQIFGFPVISAFAVPMWSATDDPTMLPDLVHIQLEKHGLNPDNPVGQLVDTRIADREENQTLVVANVLNERVVSGLPQQSPTQFEISPYLYYLPDNRVIIWKELGRLVLCATRQDHPVYFHALTQAELSSEAVQEIESLMMPLYMQGIASKLEGIEIWTESVVPGAERHLSDVLHLPARRGRKPAPAMPSHPSEFEPTAVALEKIRQAKLRRIRNIVSVCAAVYAAIVAVLVGKYLWNLKTVADLKAQAAPLKQQVGNVIPVMRQWVLTDPLRSRDRAPLEVLNRVIAPLYQFSGGVRVTNVRLEPDMVEIKGEAQNQNAAITYGNALLTNKDLKKYEFHAPTFGPPRSGIFTFTINGKLKDQENGGT